MQTLPAAESDAIKAIHEAKFKAAEIDALMIVTGAREKGRLQNRNIMRLDERVN